MIVKAWNNGAHSRNGSGYGFRVMLEDRDAIFKKEWDSIVLEIEGEDEPVEVSIDKDSFWSDEGSELHSKLLGRWMRKNGMAPWGRGNPPVIAIDHVEGNRFQVAKPKTGRRPF